MLVKISKRMIMGYIIFLCVFMVSCAPQLNLAKTTVSKLPHDCKPFQKKLYVKEITGIKLSHFDGLSSVNN
ncbi:MAG: hypothetical protein K9N39_10555, partial [Candidatus Cloacimonetes bacterium]|nr:hypothetical protein [Candidatus Cloacimonadota bacterium]